ncbi:carbohydrate-binding protein [Aquimarina sp. MMG015]|uniref:carbohydrate-binding protein n=1 Tax=Aquimarina sp. MMG015 TaxID=2822689 RepID=UPI001B3A5295|nr:carbohydrate-binding protein [Aquimarina sp. MMG015]MBQ4802096.1 carbohydrate-binding protein [Aquimarina sp. MMG015]
MKISNCNFLITLGIFLLLTNTSKAQILLSHDFDNGNLGPFNVCTTQNPNYSKVVNGRLKTWWTSEGYNGTRMDKGAEACGDQWTTYKEGWYGMNLELGSDYPKNKKAGIAQIFGFIPGFWSWESMLQVENGDLTIIHRSNGGSSSNVEEVVYSNFPYETEVPIVIHFILSNQNKGEFEIWVNGVSEYRKTNINFGFGNFDSNDVKIGNVDQDFGSEEAGSLTVLKMGQYNFQDSEYETNETRTVYYDNVSWYNGPNGYDIVNPSEDTVELCESHDAFSQIEAEDFCEQSGIQTGTTNSFVGWVNNGDWVQYKNIDFGSGANSIEMSVSSGTSGGTIEIRQGSISGTLLGTVEVTNTGSFTSWETLTANISEISEKQDIYLVFKGGSGYLLDVDWFQFSEDTTTNLCNSPLTDVTPPSNLASGISYVYYEGNWNSLPNFNSLSPISTGIASAIDLSNTQSQDNFGLTFNGYINVPSNGSYTFYTTSDDGSTLWIDGIKVVDNDGLHGAREESGTVCLEAGYHEIEVLFFERTGGNVLSVAYEGPGISKQNVPTYYGATNNTIIIQEDETGFCSAEGTIDNNHTGHTGTGFINTANANGNGIDWKLNGSAGSYTITWRYASTSNRSANLIVDGSTVASNISFNTTGSWTTWETESITVNLSDGIKDVRLEATNNSGLGNIDYVQVTGPNVSVLSCTTIGEDCSDFFGGLSITQTNPGCSNNNGQIIVNFEDSNVYTQIQLSIDGGNSYPITVNDNIGSYSFTGLSNAEYQVAARYAGGDCEYNVAHLILIQDCGDIPLNPGGVSWHDSYEANGFCWCSTNFDHNLGSKKVIVNGTQYSVVDICDELEKHPLFRSRNNGDNIYNDVQCGNGPINDSNDEPLCPGRVDMGVEGCLVRGVHWDMEWLASRDRFKTDNKFPEDVAKESPTVYPNPLKENSLLNITVSGLGLARVEVYNLAGLRIHSENINGKSAALDLQHLNTGVYIIKILDNKQSYFNKISVQK